MLRGATMTRYVASPCTSKGLYVCLSRVQATLSCTRQVTSPSEIDVSFEYFFVKLDRFLLLSFLFCPWVASSAAKKIKIKIIHVRSNLGLYRVPATGQIWALPCTCNGSKFVFQIGDDSTDDPNALLYMCYEMVCVSWCEWWPFPLYRVAAKGQHFVVIYI